MPGGGDGRGVVAATAAAGGGRTMDEVPSGDDGGGEPGSPSEDEYNAMWMRFYDLSTNISICLFLITDI